MIAFTATELGKDTKDVLNAAQGDVVEISKHGKRAFVLMSAAAYDVLMLGGDPASLPGPEVQADLWGADMELIDDA